MAWLNWLKGGGHKPTDKRHLAGRKAEHLALRYLKKQGLKYITRNYTTRGGEIDLIMREGDTLVFVEVRYRATDAYGTALQSIDGHKANKVFKAAEHYRRNKRCGHHPCRFDIVTIDGELDIKNLVWHRQGLISH